MLFLMDLRTSSLEIKLRCKLVVVNIVVPAA